MIYKDVIFGTRLRKYREAQKERLSLDDVADRVNEVYAKDPDHKLIRSVYIGAIERGERSNISIGTAMKICNGLGVTIDEIMLGGK